MELLNYIFRLGVVFAIFGFLWGIFDLAIKMLRAGNQRTVTEIYIIKGFKYLLLVNVTFLFCIEDQLTNLVVLHQAILVGLVLLMYFVGKLQNSENRKRMFKVVAQGIPQIPIASFNKRAEIIVIILALCVFIIFWFFPSLANNSASRWFHDNIMNIEDTPLFGFMFKIIGFFFLLSIFSRMFNAINYLLNSSNLSKNNMGNDNDSSSIGNDDSGEYTDYEEVD
ncbi:MAG: hypothetical protein MK066_04010 [Crocinitomicaceae bacterium]|nr:hypothetical protein [Crocinitomicaceae bacterium]